MDSVKKNTATKSTSTAKNGKTTAKPVAGTKNNGKKTFMVAFCVVVFLAIVVGILWVCYLAYTQWFSENTRFAVRNVKIVGNKHGYWSKPERESKLLQRISFDRDSNLFSLDYRELRERLESINCIERGSVVPRLPDTIELHIKERMPRCEVYVMGRRNRGRCVVDQNCVTMPLFESMAESLPLLPKIFVSQTQISDLRFGEKYDLLKPAIELTMTALSNYPNIEITDVDLRDPEKIIFWLRYGPLDRKLNAVVPTHRSNYASLLTVLESAIINDARSGGNHRQFNLLYTNQVVIR